MWATFASIMLGFGPLFLVCCAACRAQNLAEFVRQAVYLIGFGLIGAFVLMGAAVLMSLRKGDDASRQVLAAQSVALPVQAEQA